MDQEKQIVYVRLGEIDANFWESKFVIGDYVEHVMKAYNSIICDYDWYDEYMCDMENFNCTIVVYGKRLEYDEEVAERLEKVEKKRKKELAQYKELHDKYGYIDFSQEQLK